MSEMQQTNILLPKDLHLEVRKYAVEKHVSMSELIRHALRAYMSKEHPLLRYKSVSCER